MQQFSYLTNAHSQYIDQLYETYKNNPEKIDKSWKKFFEGFEFSQKYAKNSTQTSASIKQSNKIYQVAQLINTYRSKGHSKAHTNPHQTTEAVTTQTFTLQQFGLDTTDLNSIFEDLSLASTPLTLRQIIQQLTTIYCSTIGFEYTYIQHEQIHTWLQAKIEKSWLTYTPTLAEKKQLLKKLTQATTFEHFLHKKYVGKKRFSLEGGEAIIPALDAIIQQAAMCHIQAITIGMAHRGRLNVLGTILGKPYETIFNEFEDNIALSSTGDVKYHLGYTNHITTDTGKNILLTLLPNPSHLEAINPVVQGYVRAQVEQSMQKHVMPILIHGDAALAGQGVSYELLQMSQLPAYQTGGTIHIVINNQIGFTTHTEHARSSIYCTDLAKIIEAPVLHVNGNDPEALLFSVQLAVTFRQKFHKDIFIDLICYRKYGHNENDEPKFTQPALYNRIAKYTSIQKIYQQKLIDNGDITASFAENIVQNYTEQLQQSFDLVKQKHTCKNITKKNTKPKKNRLSNTGITEATITQLGKKLSILPAHFHPLKQIDKLLNRRHDMFSVTNKLDWGSAELLAYASLLIENNPVRLVGQDVKRGTFSHRHACINDSKTNQVYDMLNYLSEHQAKFSIHNSLLSEYAALGFEFGYATGNPQALTIWEAQFGDFSNGAQIIIDQFIASSETKWQQTSGLVLLLPHGYEGQGPEHSSARLERFLQLCSDNNIQVANITTPANLFHILRRQIIHDLQKPLIIMSPKSLLRHAKAVSSITEFIHGQFCEILDDKYVKKQTVKKIILCSGKVYYDLLARQQQHQHNDVAIIRIEQLYPFPTKKLHEIIVTYPKKTTKLWVQEEPSNMGAWHFINNVLSSYQLIPIMRNDSPSPATGYLSIHLQEQTALIDQAFA